MKDFHYCAMAQLTPGEMAYMDGTIRTLADPTDPDGYVQIKQAIADNFRPPTAGSKITLLSLTPLSAIGET